jgi:hypothetical protein
MLCLHGIDKDFEEVANRWTIDYYLYFNLFVPQCLLFIFNNCHGFLFSEHFLCFIDVFPLQYEYILNTVLYIQQ